ncbi:MAG: nucleotidyltransferase family protein [Dehalococcoidia bacterium]|nr:nucleotidyltransferase family protein [Dehalococcoidia bacterium]
MNLPAVVLAAGEGVRLRPLTNDRPKPMAPVGGRPALEYVVAWLRAHGVTDLFVNLHYRPEAITGHFGDGAAFGVRITYNYEPTLLGTAGGVAQFLPRLPDTFLVVYGDVITDLDLRALVAVHRERRALATIALYRVPDPWTRGVVDLRADGRIVGFREKPPRDTCAPDTPVNAGVYALERAALASVVPGTFADFGHDVFPRLLADDATLVGWLSDAYVLDYGTPEQREQADRDVRAGRLRVAIPPV